LNEPAAERRGGGKHALWSMIVSENRIHFHDVDHFHTEAIGRSGLSPEHDGLRNSGSFRIMPHALD
jgi:hypothetical protein